MGVGVIININIGGRLDGLYLFVPILYYSKSIARGAFPPFLDIITQIIPYHVVVQNYL